MELIDIYIVISLFASIIMAKIWRINNMTNLSIKMFWTAMVIFGLCICYQRYVKQQIEYIEHEKAKIAIQKEQIEKTRVGIKSTIP